MESLKPAIRRELRARRRQLEPTTVQIAGEAVEHRLFGLAAFLRARSLIAYLENENEVPTAAIISRAAKAGTAIYLPAGSEAVVARWRPGERVELGPGGVAWATGDPSNQFELPAVALIPLVAWDATGTRLGRGGGVYDRLFASFGLDKDIARIGLAYEFQEVPDLPRERWDVPLDYVVTEMRVVCFSKPRAALWEGGLTP